MLDPEIYKSKVQTSGTTNETNATNERNI